MKYSKRVCIVLLFALFYYSTLQAISSYPNFDNATDLIRSANTYLYNKFGCSNFYEVYNRNNKGINSLLSLGKYWGADNKLRQSPLYMFIYGMPFGSEKSLSIGKRHRYLGFTMYNGNFPNMYFPDDSLEEEKYDKRNWIDNPWFRNKFYEWDSGKKLNTICSDNTIFDTYSIKNLINKDSNKLFKPDYFRNSIKYGLGIAYGLQIDGEDIEASDLPELKRKIDTLKFPMGKLNGAFRTKDWENYVHIIQPPTYFSWGMGRMWRLAKSEYKGKTSYGYNYLTVPLAPEILYATPTPTTPPATCTPTATNSNSGTASPAATSTATVTPTPSGTATATPAGSPTPTATPAADEKPAGIIKFVPESSDWTNRDIPVRVYVDGVRSVTRYKTDFRTYKYTHTHSVDGELSMHSHTNTVSWRYSQVWSIGKLNVANKDLKGVENFKVSINNESSVTITREGISLLNARLSGWTGSGLKWVAGNPPKGNWISSDHPSGSTDKPTEDYSSSSGLYRIDKSTPVAAYNWANQDYARNGVHTFYYLPDNRVNFTLSDSLSGVRAVRYLWTSDIKPPEPGSMKLLGKSTDSVSEELYRNGKLPLSVKSLFNVHDTQKRYGLWYLHVYLVDRAGNAVRFLEAVNIKCMLYDFRVKSINDRVWRDVFFEKPSGVSKEDWEDTSVDVKGVLKKTDYNVSKLPLDIHPFKNYVAKKGYGVNFCFSSKGLNEELDRVEILPSFYYLKDLTPGSIAAASSNEADLYYDLGSKYFVRVGDSTRDDFKLTYENNPEFDGFKMANKQNQIGSLSKMLLTKSVRQVKDVKTSLWVGRYGLLPTTCAVLKTNRSKVISGGRLDQSLIMKKGFILVKFRIDAYKNNRRVFSYTPDSGLRSDINLKINNIPDQWSLEGGPRKDRNYSVGSVVVFNLGYSSMDDYQAGTDR